MGIYDTYGDVQIKVGDVALRYYEIGDDVDIPDGVYVAPDGIIVILGGVFIAEFESMTDKWGSVIYPGEVISWL